MSDGMTEAHREASVEGPTSFHLGDSYLRIAPNATLEDCLTLIRLILTYIRGRFHV